VRASKAAQWIYCSSAIGLSGAGRVILGSVIGDSAVLLARNPWKLDDGRPTGPLLKLSGFLVGLLSTLMGIGGGLFSNLMITFVGRTMHWAVATSATLAVLISSPGALGYVNASWPMATAVPRRGGAATAGPGLLCLADRRHPGEAD
jgi:uncharacterized membrane protein YfcA